MDDTELGTQKFQDFQEGHQQFIQDSTPCLFRILGNSRILQDFEWFSWNSVKIHKILGNSWNSSQAHRAFITRFPVSSIGGGGGGGGGGCGVWIFSGIALAMFESSICFT